MSLKIQHFVIFITLSLITSCRQGPVGLSKIESAQLPVDSALSKAEAIEAYILPYRERVKEVLDSTLAFAPKLITKEDGAYNTSAGNLMADILLSEASPIFKSRTGKKIDLVVLNHGGIRSVISKGNVSAKTAYEVMPFENSIAVVTMDGNAIMELAEFLSASGRAHPIAGMQIVLGSSGTIKSIRIGGKPLDTYRKYRVATSDYLVSGGDDMVFFKEAETIHNLNYLIRNAMIDYFRKVDTLKASVDDRFIKLK